MSLTSLLSAYVLGGVTFLPLLLIAVVATAWLTLPEARDDNNIDLREGGADMGEHGKGKELEQEGSFSSDGAANATFAVLRSYNFQTALTALSAKTTPASNGTAEGSGDGAGPESMSVYQSMYRTVFDRNKTALNRNPLAEEPDSATGAPSRVNAAAATRNIFHIVLRHGHLMLYDSPAELEVRHVISMAHHSVSLSDGDGDDEHMLDADLFIKRTAILLKPLASNANSDANSGSTPQPKPFYLFSSNCSEKEDFYHALVAAQTGSPSPQPLDPSCSIKLQSSIHSNSLSSETRAFNALINRVFLALHRTPFLEDLVRDKIEKKISRVAKPAFISYVSVQSIDLGDAGPILSNPRLKDIHISGDMILSMDVKYTGGVKVVISAVAKLDLGQRFKVRTVDLVLAGSLQRLQGRMLVRIKPPPSNRIWFCFETMPDMEIKVEPIVSSRQITYNWILRAIENRIREVFAETLVKPNWDDVPFFDTIGQTYRGGIWRGQRNTNEEPRPGSADAAPEESVNVKNEKTMSMPDLTRPATESATSSGAQTPVSSATASLHTQGLKLRSATTLPSQHGQVTAERANSMPKAARSPSFTSPSPSAPSVAIDGSNVDAFKGTESTQPSKRWVGRSVHPSSKKEAVDAIREVNDRARTKTVASTPQHVESSATTVDTGEGSDVGAPILGSEELGNVERRGSNGSKSSGSLRPNDSDTTLPLPRTPSRESINRTDTTSSTRSSQNSQPRGKALFAATAAATSAARQWTLNAVANRKGTPLFRPPSSHQPGPQEPVGRGQPLPPIGQPLPGPKTSLWGGSTFASGSVKRKPVLPARKATSEQSTLDVETEGVSANAATTGDGASSKSGSITDVHEASHGKAEDDEFGPWSENFGDAADMAGASLTSEKERPGADSSAGLEDVKHSDQVLEGSDQKPSAPPLPARRKRAPDLPKRPHERDETQDKQMVPEPRASPSAPLTLSASSGTHETHPAIPAPVINPQAEARGTLELEESDGVHVIDARSEGVAEGSATAGSRGQTVPSKHASVEEVSDESENTT